MKDDFSYETFSTNLVKDFVDCIGKQKNTVNFDS